MSEDELNTLQHVGPDSSQLPHIGHTTATMLAVKSEPRVTTRAAEDITLHFAWLRTIWRFFASPYDMLPPAPKGRWPRMALLLVALLAIAFTIYFTAYNWAIFDTYRSNAEDMGIMDQVLWNTLHGSLLHQTICNPISDTNCLGDISRFAIHFEPLMLPLALLYFIAPSPKTLLFLQTIVVAAGAFPTFWIAMRRLGSPLAGVVFALAYLLYPVLQSPLIFDFHAVTLAMAFFLFAIYFMLTRNNVGLFIACILAISTKEEVPVDVLMLGLAILIMQRRWKVGVGLIVLSLAWLVLGLLVLHSFSPIGHSSTAARYNYLGSTPLEAVRYIVTHPIQLLRDHIFDAGGHIYLRHLLQPLLFLGLLSPFTLILGGPAILINLLSSDPNMHVGVHQYSAEVVPFMLFSAISGLALLLRFIAWLLPRLRPVFNRLTQSENTPISRLLAGPLGQRRLTTGTAVSVVLIVFLALMLGSTWQQQYVGVLPGTTYYSWPTSTSHRELANTVVAMIPSNAVVCAQDTLVPHLSQRHYIYQYPYNAQESTYVVLDTKGDPYPYANQATYNESVQTLLQSPQFKVIFSQDGYLILENTAVTGYQLNGSPT